MKSGDTIRISKSGNPGESGDTICISGKPSQAVESGGIRGNPGNPGESGDTVPSSQKPAAALPWEYGKAQSPSIDDKELRT
jgi:hypothetical protein